MGFRYEFRWGNYRIYVGFGWGLYGVQMGAQIGVQIFQDLDGVQMGIDGVFRYGLDEGLDDGIYMRYPGVYMVWILVYVTLVYAMIEQNYLVIISH